MLHFVTGTAGTGKTSRLLVHMREAVQAGGRAIFLVPEQFSFEAEKLLYRELGPQLALRVEVLSFTRLCNNIFRAFGGLAGVPVTATARYLLMSVAVDELRDRLRVYRKSSTNTAFLETLLAACSEFKTAGVPPKALERFAEACADEELRCKAQELAMLYGAYQGLLQQGFTDPEDDLLRACERLELSDYFGPYTVFVDGFTTFMAAEFELLGHILAQAPQVYFAMTTDSGEDAQHGMGVFSPVQTAVRRLLRLARREGVCVAPAEEMQEPVRYRNAELAWLSRYLFRPDAAPFRDKADGVAVLAAPEPYTELTYVAAQILRLVREEGYEFRQIAVVARDIQPYLCAVETVFGRYDIPYFADGANDVENTPLAGGLLAALEAVRTHFDPQPVLLLAKSPILGLDAQAVAALENYCYCWGVRGAVWHTPFVNNPRGLSGAPEEADLLALECINATRRAVVEPLLALREALEQGSARAFAEGVFAFLQQVGAAEHLQAYAQRLEPSEQTAFLNTAAQLWDEVCTILDVFGQVLGERRMPRSRLCELFRLALGAAEIGTLPHTLDQVLLGEADRIRPAQVRAVFVIGANEGIFPPRPATGGVFTDTERRILIDNGVEVSAPSLEKSVLERFFAYFALTLPSERLFVTYPRSDLRGNELLPSVVVTQLEELFPHRAQWMPDDLSLVAGARSAGMVLAAHWHEDTAFVASLRHCLRGNASLLARMEAAANRPPHALREPALARALFGKSLRLSPSRVERYYRCPFAYFAADGLGLKPRRRVEFSPIASGSVLHNVLQVMVQRHGGRGLAALSPEQLRAEAEEMILEYLRARIDDMDALPARFRYLFGRLSGLLARLLAHLGREFAQSKFEPVAFELPIGRGGVEPLRLETPDGTPVVVEGIVDRVDVMEANGIRYVRVVDYKSGSRKFQLHDVLYGLNMQMLLYLFTICENGTGKLSGALPAGVLYMPVRESFVGAQRTTDEREVVREQEKQWRMSGLLLDDEAVLRGMEAELNGIFIPAKLGKDGRPDAKSAVASLAQMGRLFRQVRRQLAGMAQALCDGNIAAIPIQDEAYTTCEHCDYRAVCGFEPDEPVRRIAKLDAAEIFKMLEEEENV